MRETCVAVMGENYVVYMPRKSYKGIECGKPGVDYQQGSDGTKYWLCAEHYDMVAGVIDIAQTGVRR